MKRFLQFFTLGKLDILLDGQSLPEFPTRKVEALLVYLAYTGRAQPREHLADILWDERSHSQALSNLRTNLSRLNQHLSDFLLITRQDVSIHPEADVWLDAAQLMALEFSFGANDTIRSHHSAEQIEEIVALYRGDFLENVYLRDSRGFEAWLHEQRHALNKKLIHALSYLVNHYLESGNYAQGIKHAQHILALDPTHETAYRHYMQLLAQTGQRSVALAEYEKCRRILQDELNAEPEATTHALYKSILEGQVAPSIRPRSDMLPIQASNFLGREDEIAQIKQHLANRDCRLLTLIGFGGIGKTRLAYQIAEELQSEYQHGICFVSLAEIQNPRLLLSKLAETLRVTLRGSKDPKEQIASSLRDKNMLIVLDNCEHLLDELAVVSDILKVAERVKILATSRERLNFQSEWLLPIEGLSYPDDTTDADFGQYPAVRLFLQTAQRIDPRFVPEQGSAIIQICQYLAGLPLAIELAATWVRHLSPEQIVQELNKSNDLLNTTMRDIPARHRSIQFIFDESWQMLTPQEQTSLMNLAVFQAQITPEAASAVAHVSLIQLANLAEKSFLQPDKRGVYRLHDLVRGFLLTKLEASGHAAEAARRHAAYFSEKLKTFASYQTNQPGPTNNERIRSEYDNYSAALEWAYSGRQLDTLTILIQGLATHWETNFKIPDALFWLNRALELLTDETEASIRARIYCYAGIFLQHIPAQIKQAVHYVEMGTQLAHEVGDLRRYYRTMYALGQLQMKQGAHAEAQHTYQTLLAEAQRDEEEYWVGRAYNSLAGLALELEQIETAKDYLQKALNIYYRLNIVHLSALLGNLGLLAYLEHNMAQAEHYFNESLTVARANNEIFNISANLINLGKVAAETQNYDAALQNTLNGFALAFQYGIKTQQLDGLEDLGVLLARLDFAPFATLLLGAVAAQRQLFKMPSEPYNHDTYNTALDKLKQTLDPHEFESCWTKGQLTDFQSISQAVFNKGWLAFELPSR